ncbi:MAG: CNP1-like family protein [Zoogloeaceae bacterium]|jgi:hypothetical protein|nr:CNP1-like family protein [Zoogloeaceae bacterium]
MKNIRARCRGALLCLGAAVFCLTLQAAPRDGDVYGYGKRDTYTSDEDEEERADWKENQVELPGYPEPQDFYSFYVSAATRNRFFIDVKNIGIGSDGVVRYTLMIVTPSGIKNVSHEGMRCQSREKRTYAVGRVHENTWVSARGSQWTRIRNETANRYHAALFMDFFCPNGLIAADAQSVRRAIEKEGEPWAEAP